MRKKKRPHEVPLADHHSDEDDVPLMSPSASQASKAHPANNKSSDDRLFLPQMYTSVINKLPVILSQSIAGKNFRSA